MNENFADFLSQLPLEQPPHPSLSKLSHQEHPWSNKVELKRLDLAPAAKIFVATPTPLHFIFMPCAGMTKAPLTFISDEGVSVLFAPTLISEAWINLPPPGNHFEHIE